MPAYQKKIMRIISGSLGGRRFDAPKGSLTHPMSDKIRGALFGVLGDISGLTVLDAFAGSGALSFEAVSRGASRAVAIDNDKTAQNTIQTNLARLDLANRVTLIKTSASAWSNSNADMRFDLVLADPPYAEIQQTLLIKLANHAKLSGIFVLSIPPTSNFELPVISYQLEATKNYGDSKLVFYRRIT